MPKTIELLEISDIWIFVAVLPSGMNLTKG